MSTQRIAKKLLFGVFLIVFFITLDKQNEALASRKDLRQLTIEPQYATGVPGSDVKLECKAAQHIKNNQPRYKWILNGSELVFGEQAPEHSTFVYNVSSHGDSLWIQNISGIAYGTYQCIAEDLGRAIVSTKASVRMPYLYQKSDNVTTNITCNETRFCVIRPPHIVSFPIARLVWEFRKNRSEDFRVLGNSSDRELIGGYSRFVVSLEGILCNINVSMADEGEYRCRAVNGYRVLSNVYHVLVKEANVSKGFPADHDLKSKISIMVEPKNATLGVTSTASFDCIASGRNTTIKWWKGETQNLINANKKYEIPLSYRLNIRNSKNDDEDWYGCLVVNNLTHDYVVMKAYLQVREKVDLVVHWSPSLTIHRGDDLILKVTVYHGQLKWYKDGLPIDDRFLASGKSVRNIARNTTEIGDEIIRDEQTLTLKGVESNDSGIYQALAEGFETQMSDYTNVIVHVPTKAPTTNLQLSSRTVTGYETNGPRSPTRKTAWPTLSFTEYETNEPNPTRHTKTEKITTGEYGTEGSKETSRGSTNSTVAVYVSATAAGVVLIILGICLLLVRLRRTRKERSKQEEVGEETTQTIDIDAIGETEQGIEDSECQAHATPDNHVIYFTLEDTLFHNNTDNLKQPQKSTSDASEAPAYDILEAPYATIDEITNACDPITTRDDHSDMPQPLGAQTLETSFSDDLYCSLSAKRDDDNIYASLWSSADREWVNSAEEAEKNRERAERAVLASLPGIDSSVEDYVFLS